MAEEIPVKPIRTYWVNLNPHTLMVLDAMVDSCHYISEFDMLSRLRQMHSQGSVYRMIAEEGSITVGSVIQIKTNVENKV